MYTTDENGMIDGTEGEVSTTDNDYPSSTPADESDKLCGKEGEEWKEDYFQRYTLEFHNGRLRAPRNLSLLMIKRDAISVGCSVVKCPISENLINVTMSCYYGKNMTSETSRTCEGTDKAVKSAILDAHEKMIKKSLHVIEVHRKLQGLFSLSFVEIKYEQ
ncbi:hypothetical protein KIN20_009876 [Parelaphostrongylus tenuis]|uniref:Uncharacterized protein n=1 Tax=Parelaphostrongylus tenuis TaxID=148309 RepID=A0AAD5QJY7_PARTN|nr:hypothetical protein KIN20_009876 [Parelaphostrongylus tenuis]